MVASKAGFLTRMRKVLTALVEAGRVRGGASACDDILQQFDEFIDTTVAANYSTFKNFKPYEDKSRIDVLLFESMATNQRISSLWRVVKHLLLLSHGQASVERGFSVNRQIEVENLHEESVIARRLTCDHIDSVGGIQQVEMSKQLLVSAASGRQRYMAHLDEQRKKKESAEVTKKRKNLLEEIDEIKSKSKRLQNDVLSWQKSADDFSEKAEATGKITFTTKSNSLRRTAKAKQAELVALSSKLEENVQKLKEWIGWLLEQFYDVEVDCLDEQFLDGEADCLDELFHYENYWIFNTDQNMTLTLLKIVPKTPGKLNLLSWKTPGIFF